MVIAVLANDADPDNDALTVARRDAPLHGRVSVQADKTLAYTPASDFNGTDIFTYAASDGRLTDETTVVVTVNAVNDQPKFPATSTTRTVADGAEPGSAVGLPVTAADVDGEALAYALFEVDAPFFVIDPDTGQVRVGPDTVPDRRAKPSYRLRVQATDPHGARVSIALNVIVTAGGTTTTTTTTTGGGGDDDFDVGVATFVVANGWSPADVGVASVLAARTDGAAVVYTAGDELSAETAMLLREASPAEVVIVGGNAAVSRDVRTQIGAVSPESGISRVAGAGRADTAARTARRILGAPSHAGRVTLVVANGWSPPDIGAAAALAARSGRSAVIYTRRDRLPEASAALLRDYQGRPGDPHRRHSSDQPKHAGHDRRDDPGQCLAAHRRRSCPHSRPSSQTRAGQPRRSPRRRHPGDRERLVRARCRRRRRTSSSHRQLRSRLHLPREHACCDSGADPRLPAQPHHHRGRPRSSHHRRSRSHHRRRTQQRRGATHHRQHPHRHRRTRRTPHPRKPLTAQPVISPAALMTHQILTVSVKTRAVSRRRQNHYVVGGVGHQACHQMGATHGGF